LRKPFQVEAVFQIEPDFQIGPALPGIERKPFQTEAVFQVEPVFQIGTALPGIEKAFPGRGSLLGRARFPDMDNPSK
jgi:hypothetical protein